MEAHYLRRTARQPTCKRQSFIDTPKACPGSCQSRAGLHRPIYRRFGRFRTLGKSSGSFSRATLLCAAKALFEMPSSACSFSVGPLTTQPSSLKYRDILCCQQSARMRMTSRTTPLTVCCPTANPPSDREYRFASCQCRDSALPCVS